MGRSDADSASQSSYGTGTDGSSVASSADTRVQRDAQERNEEGADLLEQNRTVEDSVFASLYSLGQNREGTDYRWTALRVILEFLQLFRIVFNTRVAFHIHQKLWIWKPVYWILFRVLVVPAKGYTWFIAVGYTICVVILLSVLLTVWVALVTRKDERIGPWMKRLAGFLQFVTLLEFSIFWVAITDYLTFLFDCNWGQFNSKKGPVHHYFPDHNCTAMPHLAHMIFAGLVLVVFAFATVCMSVCESELNPLTHNHFASAVPMSNLKIAAVKILMVIISTACGDLKATQSVLMLGCSVVVTYYLLTTVPYYHDMMNKVWVGLWAGICYTSTILVIINYTTTLEDVHKRDQLTWGVLYGIFPAVLLGMAMSHYYIKYKRRPLRHFEAAHHDPSMAMNLKPVHRFVDVYEAEFLIRVMRKWDVEGVPDPESIAFGEFILKCALARFPNQPTLMILLANLTSELKQEGQKSRTHIQIAIKNKPSLVERYFIYMSQEVAKKNKSDDSMDLVGYVEFQRSYRVCVRAHKNALQAQRQLWHAVLRDNVSYKELQNSFALIDETAQKAQAVYRRAVERYPNNGKILKVYGRFLEYVANDPWKASRYYAEAMKLGTEESLLSLAGSSAEDDVLKILQGTKTEEGLGAVDEKSDAVVIINSGGTILMINNAGARMFHYAKGELDGKSVATLMPQPLSTRHNSWVQRCAMTGQNRILGSLRQVVGITKDHTIFPLTLFVQRLSGIGADTIFMGILRLAEVQSDVNLVKVWATPAGIVLCASDKFRDWFGTPSSEVIGKNVNTLSTEPEAMDRFLAENLDSLRSSSTGQKSTNLLRTQLIHEYLSPVDAQVTLELGGSDDQPILIYNMRCFADTLAMLVADAKGRINFATSQLAAMLGYSVNTLTEGMNISMMMQPPYSQLHTAYFKDLEHKPPPSSCRAGAVVHLMHVKNRKVPVTLNISRHDDGEHVQHIVKVLPASDAQLLNQQRIEVQINHQGVVLELNQGSNKDVFAFPPEELIGRPLASFINVFTQWRHKFGEDDSLLALLGLRSEQGLDVIYRVGVHSPYTDQELADSELEAASMSGATVEKAKEKMTLLSALKARHKVKPAIMTMTSLHIGEDAAERLSMTGQLDSTPMLTVSLWRTEGLSAMMETDDKLGIVRAEPAAGLLFGVPHTSLKGKSFASLIGLPPGTEGQDMLSTGGKKSAFKQQSQSAGWQTGPLKTLEARHVDGGTLNLQVQAISKDGKSAKRLLVVTRLVESDLGSLKPLLALRQTNSSDGAHNASELLATQQEESDDDDEDDEVPVPLKRGESLEEDLHDKLDSRLRVEQWMSNGVGRQSHLSKMSNEDILSPGRKSGKLRFAKAGSLGRQDSAGNREAEAFVSIDMPEKTSGKGAALGGKGDDDGSEHAPSELSDGQSGGDGLGDAASNASGAEDEILVDWRRAKRLKKLKRMMTGSLAQVAAERFRKHTYLVVLLLIAAHTTCFGVLVTNIVSRYETTRQVGDVADAIQFSQMIAICANYLVNCYDPSYASMDICDAASVQSVESSMSNSYNELKRCHQGLYLGSAALGSQGFSDLRLKEYWTTTRLLETNWFPRLGNGTSVTVNGNNTLWEMGNKYLLAEKDMEYNQAALKMAAEHTTFFQYIYQNGPESLFKGYVWTLDVYVDFAWAQFGSLSIALIILLSLELGVQILCTMYELFILNMANAEGMKHCSVFLALPSATIRSVASRQLQVDDDDGSDVDDDDMMEAMNAGQSAAVNDQPDAAGRAADAKPSKSVRLAAPEPAGDEARSTNAKGSRKLATSTSRNKSRSDKSKHKGPMQKIRQLLFGWTDLVMRVNGKKLLPHNRVLWLFMACLCVWIAVVVVIYGISYMKLAHLQGPLASLNAAAHVRFRVARIRMLANIYAFTTDLQEMATSRGLLLIELGILRKEYDSLLYGGSIDTLAVNLGFDPQAPAAAFVHGAFSDIFFKTTACLRLDKSKCHPEGSPWYDVTHAGLDAMMVRFMEQMAEFAQLPDSLAYPNHTSYDYLTNVGATDMFDGLTTASNLFEIFMISKFEEVKNMHIILLVCTLVAGALFVWKVFRPYVVHLHLQSKAAAGMLSQLPAEVDIEGPVRTFVLGWAKEAGGGNTMKGAPGITNATSGVPGAAPAAPGGWRNSLTNLLPGAPNQAVMMPAGVPGMPPGMMMMMAPGSAGFAGMPMYFQPQAKDDEKSDGLAGPQLDGSIEGSEDAM